MKAVEFIINNVLDNLSESWKMIVFPGKDNIEDVKNSVKSLDSAKQSRVSIKDLDIKNMDIDAYNSLMMSRRILDEIPTEVFMVVQTDSLICRGNTGLLDKFMKYDYVGAPWKGHNSVGNGGFSLRRKTKMLEVLDNCPKLNHNEDGFFSAGCEGHTVFKPSAEEAEEFSVETIFNGKAPFGIHKAWHHLPDKTTELDAKCPAYSILRDLNS
jgi:hypothetical protein